jgi:predicted NAD/FAD-binding protein
LGLFDKLGVELQASGMSFAVAIPDLVEWDSDSLQSVFAQKKDTLRPTFWYMLYDMKRIYKDVMTFLASAQSDESDARSLTLGDFLTARGYSHMFIHGYLIPMCASIWSTAANEVLSFPAFSILM